MNPIMEETALPTTTSNPDIEPTFVLGKPISQRLDKMEYEYEDEQSMDSIVEDGRSLRSQPSREDDAVSIARTFGVKSRTGNSLHHYASFDSSLRHNIPLGRHSTSSPTPNVPPKSPARIASQSTSLYSDDSSSVAGPSRITQEQYAASVGTQAFSIGSASGREGNGTPRSTTPTSSFYAKPRRQQPSHFTPRESSLPDGIDQPNPTPRQETIRTSDEGFDSQSNSTGPPSLRSHAPVPVDANLRSMPGVVGLGDGWAGGPQNQGKKRKLWFMKKSKAKEDEDPLALWAIQENGGDPNGAKGGQKRGVFKEAWNRSMSKFGSMPALVSGEQVNGNKSRGSVRNLLSRSRLDLAKEHKSPVQDVDHQDEKRAKRRTVAFFGLSKSQIDVSSPKSLQLAAFPAPPDVAYLQPSPQVAQGQMAAPTGLADSAHARDISALPPITIPSQESRRFSAPLSAPAGPGGLPPPWRPQSFMLPRPEPATPAPRPFSRHDDRDSLPQLDEPMNDAEQSVPSMSRGGSQDPQTSISSAGVETPITGSGDRSLKHKRSALLTSEDDRILGDVMRDSPLSSPLASRPITSRTRTPTYNLPAEHSTPGLDTLEDWAAEGKRPSSRLLRSRTPTLRSKLSPSQAETPSNRWAGASLYDRLKQALAVPETPKPQQAFEKPSLNARNSSGPIPELETSKDLPNLPSRTSTLVMPGAYPITRSPEPVAESPLPPSPYDITQAVAQQMLATPPPSRPVSSLSTRKRGLSGDMWFKRLSKINETGDSSDATPSRPTSRLDKRRSYSALTGRFSLANLRRSSSRSDDLMTDQADSPSRDVGGSAYQPTPISMPTLEALNFGEDDLGIDDILDESRRMSLIRDLEAALPLPPARSPLSEPSTLHPASVASSPSQKAGSIAMTSSSSEATVLAPPFILGTNSHRSHPSTSTTFSSPDQDETLTTPAQLRKSLDERRGSHQSDEVERTFNGQQWPSRGHRRGTSMGSIGELAHDIMHNKGSALPATKRDSVVFEAEDEDETRRREREVRTMSFASGVSSMSSAMSLDEEEAVPMSAVRVAAAQHSSSKTVHLSPRSIRA